LVLAKDGPLAQRSRLCYPSQQVNVKQVLKLSNLKNLNIKHRFLT
jgi:hypothetical protein